MYDFIPREGPSLLSSLHGVVRTLEYGEPGPSKLRPSNRPGWGRGDYFSVNFIIAFKTIVIYPVLGILTILICFS